ncbi:UDP-glucuronosyltransferase 1-9 isoform X2 [Agrilus planipennis]|uniref:UDP-glucuronosyltransferase n=1 Tax=Agrilus planipennis TaxID=224129 RepID=A0A1W4WMF1_AGRPL|nr:UDP-glucuronosyltransferase 1-9 isoform X2 [Agrilus planipennis]
MKTQTLCFILFIISQIECYKILVLFVHPGKSHFLAFEPLFKALAEKQHEITVVSYFPQKETIANYTDISPKSKVFTYTEEIVLGNYDGSWISTIKSALVLAEFSKISCKEHFSTKEVQNLIKSDVKFDVVIYEIFASDCLLGFAHKFKAPLIGVSTPGTVMPWAYDRVGNPSNPSFILNQFYNHYGPFDFSERLYNTILDVYTRTIYRLLTVPFDNEIIRKHFGNDVPDVQEIVMNTSMILLNSHFSLSQPFPQVPAIVEVCGVHIQNPKQLSQNIEKWINESTHGVIYFSMGSMIKGHTFPEEKRNMFLRVFKRLPQRVLWKWESDMPGKPDNIMIQRWMPQYDILCHPNVKAFISHGGMLGTTETVQCGVPALVMPQFGDQFTNAKALEASGGGLIFDFWRDDEETLYNKLKQLLEPSFQQKAKQLSARFKDRPLPPLETAIYWVEYVARHGGAHHMRTAAVGMPLYKYLLLDVIAFLLAVITAILWITYRIVKFVGRKIIGQSIKVKTN